MLKRIWTWLFGHKSQFDYEFIYIEVEDKDNQKRVFYVRSTSAREAAYHERVPNVDSYCPDKGVCVEVRSERYAGDVYRVELGYKFPFLIQENLP